MCVGATVRDNCRKRNVIKSGIRIKVRIIMSNSLLHSGISPELVIDGKE